MCASEIGDASVHEIAAVFLAAAQVGFEFVDYVRRVVVSLVHVWVVGCGLVYTWGWGDPGVRADEGG